MGEIRTVNCIFCDESIYLSSTTVYKDHFVREHKIISYDTSKLVLITLKQEIPSILGKERRSREVGTQTDNCTGLYSKQEYPDTSDSEACFGFDSDLNETKEFNNGDVKSWRKNITCGQDETFLRSSSRLSNDDTCTRNSSRASRTSSSDPTPIEKSCSNGRSSTKRSRSSSREGCSVKQARTEKVCHKCETEFDQIFEYESHLVTCYNKIHRTTAASKTQKDIRQPLSSISVKEENTLKQTQKNNKTDPESKFLLKSRYFFLCKLCGREIKRGGKSQHLQDEHTFTNEAYEKLHGDTDKSKLYSCLVCKERVAWVRLEIRKHLKKHNISIAEYETKYKTEILDQIDKSTKKSQMCTVCNKFFPDRANYYRHRNRTNCGETSAAVSSKIPEAPPFQSSPRDESTPSKNRIQISSPMKKDWYNRYGYECPKCNIQFSYKGNLTHHIKHIHKVEIEDFFAEHGALQVSESFTCKICNSSMDWATEKIKQHLDNKHCLSLKNYGEIYIDTIPFSDLSRPDTLREESEFNQTISQGRSEQEGDFQQSDDDIHEGNSIDSSSSLKNLLVDVPRLEKAYVTKLFQDDIESIDNEPSDYSHLSKQDLGKCVNSAIEDWFTLSSPVKNPNKDIYEDNLAELNSPSETAREFICPTCLFRSNSKQEFIDHSQDLHMRIGIVSCCGVALTTRWNLFLHLESSGFHSAEDYSNHHFHSQEAEILRAYIKTKPSQRRVATTPPTTKTKPPSNQDSDDSEPETHHQDSDDSEPETNHQNSDESEPETNHQDSEESEPETNHQDSEKSEPLSNHRVLDESEPFILDESKPLSNDRVLDESEPVIFDESKLLSNDRVLDESEPLSNDRVSDESEPKPCSVNPGKLFVKAPQKIKKMVNIPKIGRTVNKCGVRLKYIHGAKVSAPLDLHRKKAEKFDCPISWKRYPMIYESPSENSDPGDIDDLLDGDLSDEGEEDAIEAGLRHNAQITEIDLKIDVKVTDSGSKNGTKVTESGSKNGTKVTESGSKNVTKVTESGSKNGTKVTESGSKNGMKVTESGSKNGTKVTESGSKNGTKVTESGSKNDIKGTEIDKGNDNSLESKTMQREKSTENFEEEHYTVDNVAYEDNDVDDMVRPHVIWANGSTYECRVCHRFKAHDQKQFIKHIVKNHNFVGLKEYKTAHGDPLSLIRKAIECAICHGVMIHDYLKIYTHLRKFHKNVSVEEYHEAHVLKQPTTARPDSATPDSSVDESISPTPEKERRVNDLDESISLTPEKERKVEVMKESNSHPTRKEEEDSYSLDSETDDGDVDVGEDDEGHEKDEDEDDDEEQEQEVADYKVWANKCLIECRHPGCEFTTRSVIDFRMHTLSNHSQLFEQYCSVYSLDRFCAWTRVLYTICRMCNDSVVHCQDSVDRHMLDNHQLSGFMYYKQHISVQEADEDSGCSQSFYVADEIL